MLLLLSIGYTNTRNDMYYKFSQLCSYLKEKSVEVAIVESSEENINYIKCLLKENAGNTASFKKCEDFFYAYVSSIIYEFISSEYEEKNIKKIVQDNYYYLESKEKTEIIKRCNALLLGKESFGSDSLISSISCKNSIIKKIQDYLDDNREIHIDGFVRFRLKKIMEELNIIVDKVVEDYILEEEYSEFIKLLKYFVDVQESRYELVNIFIDKNGSYQIIDENGADISSEFFGDFKFDLKDSITETEDILISALITSSPLKIVVHGFENIKYKESLDTLLNIFGEKIILCTGCEKCKALSDMFI